MGTTLTGTTPQDTYDSLIKVTDNGPLSGTAKYLSDGLGNDSVLALSTSAIAIGTNTALAARLVTARGRVAISNASGANDSQLALYADGTTNGIYSTYNSTGSYLPMAFYTSDVERVRIDAAGNVGISLTAPTQRLSIRGNQVFTNQAADGVANSLLGEISSQARGYGNQDANMASIQFRSNPSTWFRGEIAFLTNGADGTDPSNTATERGRFTSDGYLRLTSSSAGIQFNGDTAAANALDDYEEGTWTMGIAFGGASVGVTYTLNTGTYTKIGRQVTVNGYLTLSNKGSSTGTARITGLPFTIANSNSNYSGVAFAELAFITRTGNISGYGIIGATTIYLLETSTLGALSALTDANFANNSTIMVSLTYFV